MKRKNENTVEMRIRDVPEELHTQFKHICLDERKSISQKVIELVQKCVEKGRPGA